MPTPGSSTQSQDDDGLQLPLSKAEEPPIWWDPSKMNLPLQSSGPDMPYSQPTSNELSWTRPYAEDTKYISQVETKCKS
jgi:hypothetical protein